MNIKKYIFLFVVTCVFIIGFIFVKQNNVESLRFSNTSSWAENLVIEMNENQELLKKWEGRFDLVPYPKNTSEITKSELEELLALKSERTPEKVQEINNDIYNGTILFAGNFLPKYFSNANLPKMSKLWKEYTDLSTIVMQEKKRFDRVRPHILEPNIEPIIEVPGHPAYPSGHSTQAYLIAEMMSLIDPSRKDEFFAEAYRIAYNREIAGVHYASDTEAGKNLAHQYIAIRLQDPEFVKIIREAKEEWEESSK